MSNQGVATDGTSSKAGEVKISEESKSLQGGKKLSVLIVDDDQLIQMMHVALVKASGVDAEILIAENGEVAVDLCRSGKSFDLILMDKHMPIMDGVRATRELRKMGVKSMIIGVTACSMDYEVKPFIEAGLNECYQKPLDPEMTKSILAKLSKGN
ncbi:two-component response regulator ARR22-like [Punica granatum]|uniref:Response regulatory domain-containing protein n=2 Tax=Punica granatum TaxID=22663 RepID=A0A218X5K0_PUNGR|nr:two-component response regulator ARR22-like [Punica granatum]OWM80193.1 hypothetical protein CDL15_Pgr019357 [Punica granatum]PKI71789.1 hypothetical protein CRG98_007805 [Punica granatum]